MLLALTTRVSPLLMLEKAMHVEPSDWLVKVVTVTLFAFFSQRVVQIVTTLLHMKNFYLVIQTVNFLTVLRTHHLR